MLSDSLNDSNRGAQRVAVAEVSFGVVNVEWSINDNLTENMIRTGARMDAAKLITAIHDSGIAYDMVNLVGTFPLVDAFGNSEETKIVWLTYERTTVDKINWSDRQYVDYVLYNNIYEIADHIKLHAVMQE